MSWLNFVFAATGLVLSPFGAVQDLLRSENPWHGFDAQEAVLTVVRVHRIQSTACHEWIQALLSDAQGKALLPEEQDGSWSHAWKAWEPWSSDDKNAVQSCNQFPCNVKLNNTETSLVSSATQG